MAFHIRVSKSDHDHESEGQDYLAKKLSEDWLVLSNPQKPRTGYDIDCLLLSSLGAIVVELKNWRDGTLADDENLWTFKGKPVEYTDNKNTHGDAKSRIKPNPIKQATAAARGFRINLRHTTKFDVWFDACSLAGPPNLKLSYTHEIVKQSARPLSEADVLIKTRVELGKRGGGMGCKPLRRDAAEAILGFLGVNGHPDAVSWLSRAYAPPPPPPPKPAPPPPPKPAPPPPPKPAPKPTPKPDSFPLGCFLVVLAAVFLGFFVFSKLNQSSHESDAVDEIVVAGYQTFRTTRTVNVRTSPSTRDGQIIGTIEPGIYFDAQTVRMSGDSDEWAKVALQSGDIGYVWMGNLVADTPPQREAIENYADTSDDDGAERPDSRLQPPARREQFGSIPRQPPKREPDVQCIVPSADGTAPKTVYMSLENCNSVGVPM